MAPRIDKTESSIGGIRATLFEDVPAGLLDTIVGVGLDSQGRALVGEAGNSGFVGIAIPTKWLSHAGQQLDIFRHGDVVDIPDLAAGTKYFLAEDGTLATTGTVYAGFTVEADRLVLSGFSGVETAAGTGV